MYTALHRLGAIALVTVTLGTLSSWKSATAALFTQQEVDQSKFIAIASPYGNQAYQLLVLEQVADSRQCWQDNGTTVDPLLLQFDFTGICSRGTDSNGYSIRMAGEDLGLKYRLRLVKRNDELVLLGSTSDRKAPEIEVGRTQGLTSGFSKIVLNPGWRFTKRVYDGRTLGHVYLTSDQSLSSLGTAPSPAPTQPTVSPVQTPINPPVAIPATPPAPTPVAPSVTIPALQSPQAPQQTLPKLNPAMPVLPTLKGQEPVNPLLEPSNLDQRPVEQPVTQPTGVVVPVIGE